MPVRWSPLPTMKPNWAKPFSQRKPSYEALKLEMLTYAEASLYGTSPEGKRTLQLYVNDFDTDFEELVKAGSMS
jgi:hypothetical protein